MVWSLDGHPCQPLLLLRFPGVLTDAEIARLDSSTHQIQRSFPGIKTVLRTRAETPSCTTQNHAGSSVLTVHVVKHLGTSTAHLDLESISWTSWGREEEVSSTVQDMVLDDQGNGWAQGGVGPEVR